MKLSANIEGVLIILAAMLGFMIAVDFLPDCKCPQVQESK